MIIEQWCQILMALLSVGKDLGVRIKLWRCLLMCFIFSAFHACGIIVGDRRVRGVEKVGFLDPNLELLLPCKEWLY